MSQTSAAQSGVLGQLQRWAALRPQLTLVLITLAALGPFVAKPFNIDDPLFLWAAKHIQSQPGNFYNFTVNWYGYPEPMWEVTKNPPLACYYLALAALVGGWNEIALHCAFLLPAIAVVLGTYRLAKKFCARPFFAAVTALFMPVLLVSSTSLMCDVLMLAFWIWAVVLWVEGLEKPDFARLAVSAVLMTLAAYSKYFGLCVVPLLMVYSVVRTRRAGARALFFLIPIAGLIAYQWLTFHLYGKGLLTDAGGYVHQTNPITAANILPCILIALAFTGGCTAIVTLVTPWLWGGRMLGIMAILALAVAWAVFGPSFWQRYYFINAVPHLWLEVEVILFALGGVSVLALAITDAWRNRDAESVLLLLWIVGTFLFAGFVNWTVNGRSILPMAPAVAILLARRLVPTFREGRADSPVALGSMIAVALGLVVTLSDYSFAQTCRVGAEITRYKLGQGPGALWYMGHWGWQYYMDQMGVPMLPMGPGPHVGDVIALPVNNVNTIDLDQKGLRLGDKLTINEGQFCATICPYVGAGFYSSIWGPLPFAFGNVPPERVNIYFIDAPKPAAKPVKEVVK